MLWAGVVTQTTDPSPRSDRHFGLDWLRIAAFMLLIVYHIGMVFAPWDWVIKTPYRVDALIAPMSLLTPWRLPLLFAVSGYASWHLFTKSGSASRFLRSRNVRLLIPLAFGMAVLVPIEMWVRVMDKGYPHGLIQFWTHDYWRSGEFWGREFPSWEHLWFVAYLWTYTALLAAGLAWARAPIERGTAWMVAWLAKGWRILWAPAMALAAVKVALTFLVEEEHGLFRDWAGHAQYLPMFLFGFVLAGAPQLWAPLQRWWKLALTIAVTSGAIVVAVELIFPGEAVPPHWVMAAERAAVAAMAWTMTVVLFVLADRHWNRDHRWRKPLAEAVFPFYLMHQPAIVLITWYSLPYRLSPLLEFVALLAGTAAICAAFYLFGREVGWLRPLIGLGPRARRKTPAVSQQPA